MKSMLWSVDLGTDKICQHIFVACCVLHNMMLDEMVREDPPSKIRCG